MRRKKKKEKIEKKDDLLSSMLMKYDHNLETNIPISIHRTSEHDSVFLCNLRK
jgi:hypothetical protein